MKNRRQTERKRHRDSEALRMKETKYYIVSTLQILSRQIKDIAHRHTHTHNQNYKECWTKPTAKKIEEEVKWGYHYMLYLCHWRIFPVLYVTARAPSIAFILSVCVCVLFIQKKIQWKLLNGSDNNSANGSNTNRTASVFR